MRLGPAGPALHWRHLHQQGSAACSIFLQGFAGWGTMPLAALCCSPLCLLSTAQTEKTRQRGMLVGRALSCVALSQIRPLQLHLVRTHDAKNLHRQPLRNGQRAVGARHLYGFASGGFPSPLAGLAMAPASPKFSSAFEGPQGVIHSILDISAQISSRTRFIPRSLHADALQSCKLAAANLM